MNLVYFSKTGKCCILL